LLRRSHLHSRNLRFKTETKKSSSSAPSLISHFWHLTAAPPQGDKTKREWAQTLEDESGQPRHTGCIIRIDRDGTIPQDNFGIAKGVPGCWAYGVRNGYRSSWDLPSGRYFIAEVGGNIFAPDFDEAHEDLHVLTLESGNGANMGWPVCAGYCAGPLATGSFPDCSCTNAAQPLYSYSHFDGRACIVGGFVYHGSSIPDLAKSYVFGDYIRGNLKYLQMDDQGKPTGVYPFDSLQQPISISAGSDGSIYVASLGGNILRYQGSGPPGTTTTGPSGPPTTSTTTPATTTLTPTPGGGQESCVGRCESGYNPDFSCQCDDGCIAVRLKGVALLIGPGG
jgi:hypothetical protein